MNLTAHYDSPLGGMTLASEGKVLTGLWFDGQKFFAATLEAGREEKALPIFDRTFRWLDTYFAGKEPKIQVPFVIHGTPFQHEVWEILMAIPYGQTITYGEIAQRIAKKQNLPRMSAQAVGGAIGRNPLTLIIPCHRVVGVRENLTGYAGGLDKKAQLLKLEGVTR